MRAARFANAFFTIWEEEETRGFGTTKQEGATTTLKWRVENVRMGKMEGRMCEWDV